MLVFSIFYLWLIDYIRIRTFLSEVRTKVFSFLKEEVSRKNNGKIDEGILSP